MMASIILLTILVHYFIPIVAAILVGYIALAMFYTASSRELKRLGEPTLSLGALGKRFILNFRRYSSIFFVRSFFGVPLWARDHPCI